MFIGFGVVIQVVYPGAIACAHVADEPADGGGVVTVFFEGIG